MPFTKQLAKKKTQKTPHSLIVWGQSLQTAYFRDIFFKSWQYPQWETDIRLLDFIFTRAPKMKVFVAQLFLTLCDPVDFSLPGSSIHGILQVRILEWVAMPSSRDLPDPEIEPRSPALLADSLSSELPGKQGMAIHSSILAWRIPWTEEPGGLQSLGSQNQTGLKQLSTHTHPVFEWETVHEVAKNWTQLSN